MHGHDQPAEATPHLGPALTAMMLAVVVLWAFGAYARSLERRSIAALAADEAVIEREGALSPVRNQGIALQEAALEADGLLVVYGSSELLLQAPYNRPFHATNVFRDRPTGFAAFPVGKSATTSLILLQKLAAAGPAVRGRKVAISLSPSWFIDRLTARPDGYAGNFSDLHAGELVFSTRLSLGLRRDAARRMLRYPKTLANRPLLRFALENLADGSPLGLARYDAVFPLGMLHNAIVRYQDHGSAVWYLWTHPPRVGSPSATRDGRPPDWSTWHRMADEAYRPHSDNNELGMDNDKWVRGLREEWRRQRAIWSEAAFLRRLEENQEWVDLDLLLRELTELGARPMLLSMPLHGGWYDRCGVSSSARRAFYERLRAACARHGAPLVDFADHDSDRAFSLDEMGHLAPRGLVYYNQVLDGFYHGAIPPPSELPALASSSRGGTGLDPPARPRLPR